MSRRLSHAHWGTFEANLRGGRIDSVSPFGHDSHPSALIQSVPSAVHAASRVAQPMVREGYLLRGPGDLSRRRGAEPFVPVSWEEVLQLVSQQLRDVKEEHGNKAIFGGSYGWSSAGRINHARTLVHRFLYGFGGCVDQVTNYSWGAAAVLLPHIVGGIEAVAGPVTDWPSIIKNTKLMVLFGGAAEKNMLITTGGAGNHESPGWLKQARDAGVEFVSISPLKRDCSDWLGAEWLPIRPGADTALMLAFARTLIVNDRVDLAFMDKCTVGYERFRDYVLGLTDGRPKSPAWASGLTGIDADRISGLALRMADARTMLSATWSLQRKRVGIPT